MAVVALCGSAGVTMLIRSRRSLDSNRCIFSLVIEFITQIFINTLLTLLIISCILGLDGVDVTAFESFDFFSKYSIITLIIAIVVPYVEEIWKKVFEVSFSIEK